MMTCVRDAVDPLRDAAFIAAYDNQSADRGRTANDTI
jgi:hypothetical protein